MAFPTRLIVEYVDGRRWLIVEPFDFQLNAQEFVRVSAGEITDFASIPDPLKLIWPSPGGPWDKPAVIHDHLYIHPYVQRVDGPVRLVDRREADAIFAAAMRATETHTLAVHFLSLGVRVGGGPIWDRHRREEAGMRDRALAAQWWLADPWPVTF